LVVTETEWDRSLGVHGRVILKWILKKQSGRMWIALIWLRIVTGGELF
jgi:hypothetical protein